MALPSDEEYLLALCEDERDPLWLALQRFGRPPLEAVRAALKDSPSEASLRDALPAGVYESLQREVYQEASSDQPHQGLLEAIQTSALGILRDDREALEKVPVGVLATRFLNAETVKTPRGGAAILLDAGVIRTDGYTCALLYCAFDERGRSSILRASLRARIREYDYYPCRS